MKQRIDDELDARLRCHFSAVTATGLEDLRVVLADGKRLRGSFVCLVAQALGGSPEAALPAAVAIEITQAASLVHDDLVDADVVRRGRTATWKRLTPRRAVLVADVMFATALQSMAEIGAAQARTLAHAIVEMAQGAMQEIETTDGAYAAVAGWKTGSLFAAATRLGAHAAAASPGLVETAGRYGAHAGYAYQVADDLVDVRKACSRELTQRDILPLASTLRHFSRVASLPSEPPADTNAFNAWLTRSSPQLLEAMRAEIEAGVFRAEDEAGGFPETPYGRLLREAPRECVAIMLRETVPPAVCVP